MSGGSGPDARRIGVLFVCHGNICRSPLAEGVFKHLVVERGLERHFRVESAGTYAMTGNHPHPLSVEVAQDHGIALATVSRSIDPSDLHAFDHIVVMDRENHADVTRLAEIARRSADPSTARIQFLRRASDPSASGADLDVPDPITGGPEHYRHAYALIQAGCRALLDELAKDLRA